MATSSLYHSEETPPSTGKGHGTAALGPSDSTDSGSDIQGGLGMNHAEGLTTASGTTSDEDLDGQGASAGADIGDADLDSDSDRMGTGERGAAGRDSTTATDQQLRVSGTDELIDAETVSGDPDDDEDEDEDAPGDTEPRRGASRASVE